MLTCSDKCISHWLRLALETRVAKPRIIDAFLTEFGTFAKKKKKKKSQYSNSYGSGKELWKAVCFHPYTHSLQQVVGERDDRNQDHPPNKGSSALISDALFQASSVSNVLGQFTGEKKQKQNKTGSVDARSHSLQIILRVFHAPPPSSLEVTWQSPAPPPPQARASPQRGATCEAIAPRRAYEAPVLTKAQSSRRRSRSSRTRGGSGVRSRAPVQAWWWDGGTTVLWQWHWWHWCVTP